MWAGKKGEKSSQGRKGKAGPEARDVVCSISVGTKKEWLEWEEKNQGRKRHPEIQGRRVSSYLKKIGFEGKFT